MGTDVSFYWGLGIANFRFLLVEVRIRVVWGDQILSICLYIRIEPPPSFSHNCFFFFFLIGRAEY